MSPKRHPARTVVLGLAALTLTAAGCGSTANPASEDQSSYNSMSVSDLSNSAAEEGSVTWYVAIGAEDAQPIVEEFNKTYPDVKVDVLRLSADKIPPRVITEQRGGKYNADVVTGDALQVVQLVHAKALQPYEPPDAARLPAGLSLPKGYAGVAYANTTVIGFNPTAAHKEGLAPPSSWQDLTRPEWRGHFSIDPAAVNWYDAMIASMGHAKAHGLLEALGKNDPVPVESHTQALTDVRAGEPVAGATIYGYMAAPMRKDDPSRVDFVNPDPLPVSVNLTDVANGAPHPAAARLFDDWLVSKQGQQAIVDVSNDTSLRPDVENDSTVWDPQTWKPAWGDPALSPEDYNAELAEMKSALEVQ